MKRWLCEIMRRTRPSRAASIIRSHSARLVAIGFSTSTWYPRRALSTAIVQ